MKKTKENILCDNSQSHSHSQVKRSPYGTSFLENLKAVKEQTEFATVPYSDRSAFAELCIIIAEAVSLPDNSVICIEGQDYPSPIIKEIYSMLTREHLELVAENFRKAPYKINHKKTYLRTALYNSVFELEAHYDNEARADGIINPIDAFKIGGGNKK